MGAREAERKREAWKKGEGLKLKTSTILEHADFNLKKS